MPISPNSAYATVQSMTVQVSFDLTSMYISSAIAQSKTLDKPEVDAKGIARTLRNTQLGDATITDAMDFNDNYAGVSVDLQFTENPSDMLAGSVIDKLTELIIEQLHSAPVSA